MLMVVGLVWSNSIPFALTLPPPDDIPEEILRAEIITEARSPIDGKPLTAAQYQELQQRLATSPNPPEVNPKIRHLLFLLKIRKLIRTILPF
jgi:hypothetical protein